MNLHVHVSDLITLFVSWPHPYWDFYRNGYQYETKQQNNAYLKIPTKLTWSIDNKVKCNTDNFMQYNWVSLNRKYSTIKMTHLYCISYL